MFWKVTSDAEVIARARRSLRQFERWGHWTAAFHYGLAICMGLAIAWAGQFVVNLAVGAQNRVELVFGFVVGVLFGTMLHYVAHNLVTARLANVPDRRDRLLVQFHDALIECVRVGGDYTQDALDLEAVSSPDEQLVTDVLRSAR